MFLIFKLEPFGKDRNPTSSVTLSFCPPRRLSTPTLASLLGGSNSIVRGRKAWRSNASESLSLVRVAQADAVDGAVTSRRLLPLYITKLQSIFSRTTGSSTSCRFHRPFIRFPSRGPKIGWMRRRRELNHSL